MIGAVIISFAAGVLFGMWLRGSGSEEAYFDGHRAGFSSGKHAGRQEALAEMANKSADQKPETATPKKKKVTK